MSPLVRRSWAPREHTPVIRQRTRSHRKVSAIAALVVPQERKNVKLYFRLVRDANFNASRVRSFLRQLGRQISTPLIIVWDRFLPHRAVKVAAFIKKTGRFHSHFLPPYAPELDPVEYLWGWLKGSPLANFAPDSLEDLADRAGRGGKSVQRKEPLLRSFVKHSGLSLRLK